MSLNSRTVSWIESLAHQEGEIAAGERNSIDITTAKETVLRDETIHFSRTLLAQFKELAGFLNRRLPADSLQISIVSLSETGDEFAVERAPLRLVFRAQMGVVQFLCEKRPNQELQYSGSIEAKFGAFYELDWIFLGSRVNAEQFAKYYLTELVQTTRQLSH